MINQSSVQPEYGPRDNAMVVAGSVALTPACAYLAAWVAYGEIADSVAWIIFQAI